MAQRRNRETLSKERFDELDKIGFAKNGKEDRARGDCLMIPKGKLRPGGKRSGS